MSSEAGISTAARKRRQMSAASCGARLLVSMDRYTEPNFRRQLAKMHTNHDMRHHAQFGPNQYLKAVVQQFRAVAS